MTTQPKPKVRTMKGSPYSTVETLLKRLEAPAQLFEINPGRKSTIVGGQGTRLTIFPNAFRDTHGRVIDQPVELQLREVFSKKDVLLSNKMTTSEDRLMESAGQIWIAAFYQGQMLDLTYPISIELPVKPSLRNPLSVRIYSGSTASTRGFKPETVFDWALSDKKSLPIRQLSSKKYYRFWLYQFNWINCKNAISRRKGRSMVSAKAVSLVEEFDDLQAYLILTGAQSMARMHRTNDHFTAFNIPSNFGAKTLMIGIYQGTVYYGIKEIEKTKNCQVFVHLEPLASTELLGKLEKL